MISIMTVLLLSIVIIDIIIIIDNLSIVEMGEYPGININCRSLPLKQVWKISYHTISM